MPTYLVAFYLDPILLIATKESAFPEYGMAKDVLDQGLESPFDEKLETMANRDTLLQTELYNPHNLTPLTPSFQFSE